MPFYAMLPSIQDSRRRRSPLPKPHPCRRWLLHLRIIHSVGVLTYDQMRSTPLALRMSAEMYTQVMVNTPDAVLCVDSNCCDLAVVDFRVYFHDRVWGSYQAPLWFT
ncbi:hypothetical protein PISMIDRAFT_452895 [Pisolithus microcarpus 441]|uniref:Uncharacterized protein n=1 Tax=Pisolithus microcarpus 441 TaxID=765257 RepID=A0A0C9Y5W3_9AGAM|nr:hypothetical protein PISMIDRAFT_452895 [Pisolithus microcarpus 441]